MSASLEGWLQEGGFLLSALCASPGQGWPAKDHLSDSQFLGAQKYKPPGHQIQAFKRYPLCGLHVPASFGGATRQHQVRESSSASLGSWWQSLGHCKPTARLNRQGHRGALGWSKLPAGLNS